MKVKTRCARRPYYSPEPMKCALRVIFWCSECFLMIPGAPQPQIWTQNLKSKKSSFSSFLVFSKFGFELWPKWSFPHPLTLFFCTRSLKCLKFPAKHPKAQTAGQKYENFEKLTPEIFKMSFFMKFKTSCTLPPYYSTEPMKYALRVIFWCWECFLMIPEAPRPQIWTQSRNLKNHHFHHFLCSLCSVLVLSRNGHSRVPWSSPFACAH